MKYVFIKKFETGETSIGLIGDPLEVYKSGVYKPENGDKIYQLGSEVTVELSITQKPKYRSAGTAKRSNAGLKGDLGVGEYRG